MLGTGQHNLHESCICTSAGSSEGHVGKVQKIPVVITERKRIFFFLPYHDKWKMMITMIILHQKILLGSDTSQFELNLRHVRRDCILMEAL